VLTVSEEDRIPTVQHLSEVQRKSGVRGRAELHERESTMDRNKNPIQEGGRSLRERRGGSIAPLGKSHQGGGEGVVVDHTIISLVLRFQLPEE